MGHKVGAPIIDQLLRGRTPRRHEIYCALVGAGAGAVRESAASFLRINADPPCRPPGDARSKAIRERYGTVTQGEFRASGIFTSTFGMSISIAS